MVLFKCKTCAASVMHRDVDKHVGKCSGPLALKCVDCDKDFFGQQYAAHSSCFRPKMAELPAVPMVSTKPSMSMVPTATKNKLNVTKNTKAPKVKGGKQVKKGLSRSAPTEHSIKLQEQWKQAGLVSSQDPSLTVQQKALLVNAYKQPGPLKIRSRTIKQSLKSTCQKLMTSLRVTELVGEVLRMIESEFKNINGPQKEDVTKLTKNQKMIGSILTASEAPGLQPSHKSLLATIADDKLEQDRLLSEYVRVTFDACHHRIESVASQAFKKFEAEFLKINGRKPVSKLQKNNKKKNSDIKKIEPIGVVKGTEDKKQTNGEKEVEIEPKEKKDKRKNRKDVDESKENEIDKEKNVDEEIDTTYKKSKKRKHKEEVQNGEELLTGEDHKDAAVGVEETSLKKSKKRKHKEEVQNGEVLSADKDHEDPAVAEEETAHKKSKKEKKRSKGKENVDEEMVNSSANEVSDNSAIKKSKKHKKQKDSLGEEPSEKAENNDSADKSAELIEDSELSRKKKKHTRREETEDGEPRKKDKKGRAVAVEL